MGSMAVRPKPLDPEDFLQVLVDIARAGAPRSHIMSEFERCVLSSAGSSDASSSPLPIDPSSPTVPSTLPTGTSEPGRHIEDDWWTEQDRDQSWIRQWEEQELDDTDPQSWK